MLGIVLFSLTALFLVLVSVNLVAGMGLLILIAAVAGIIISVKDELTNDNNEDSE